MHLVMVPQIMPLFILLRVFYIRYQKNGFPYQKLWFIVGSFRKNAYLCKKLLGLNVINEKPAYMTKCGQHRISLPVMFIVL